jgi:hypothetical protein
VLKHVLQARTYATSHRFTGSADWRCWRSVVTEAECRFLRSCTEANSSSTTFIIFLLLFVAVVLSSFAVVIFRLQRKIHNFCGMQHGQGVAVAVGSVLPTRHPLDLYRQQKKTSTTMSVLGFFFVPMLPVGSAGTALFCLLAPV